MPEPLVSVVVPCFNHAQFVSEAVQSVLSQTHTSVEVIITDDCSTDQSWDLIQTLQAMDPRVRCVRHSRNSGLPRSRNDAINIARGEFIAFCDSDDVWEINKLATQIEQLRQHPDDDIAYCDSRIIDEHGKPTGQLFSELYPLPPLHEGMLFASLIKGNFINVQSAIIRKACLRTVPAFDDDLGALEDWWFWIQMSAKHRFKYSSAPLARYRVHSQSMNSMRKRSFPISRIKIYRRLLAKFPHVSRRDLSDIKYTVGVDLIDLGRRSAGRAVLASSLIYALETGAVPRFTKGCVRLAQSFCSKTTSKYPFRARYNARPVAPAP